ncbi:uncharacterized protein V6R79_014230 [Siganus canaliculatus]
MMINADSFQFHRSRNGCSRHHNHRQQSERKPQSVPSQKADGCSSDICREEAAVLLEQQKGGNIKYSIWSGVHLAEPLSWLFRKNWSNERDPQVGLNKAASTDRRSAQTSCRMQPSILMERCLILVDVVKHLTQPKPVQRHFKVNLPLCLSTFCFRRHFYRCVSRSSGDIEPELLDIFGASVSFHGRDYLQLSLIIRHYLLRSLPSLPLCVCLRSVCLQLLLLLVEFVFLWILLGPLLNDEFVSLCTADQSAPSSHYEDTDRPLPFGTAFAPLD